MGWLRNVKTQKYILWALFSLPLIALTVSLFVNPSADPYERIAHITGEWALRLLVLTLLITPLRNITCIKRFGAFRRTTGVFSFIYALVHVCAYVVFEAEFSPIFLIEDAIERNFIFFGLMAFALIVPLGITSNNYFVCKLGRKWKMLHQLVFPIAILATIHFFMLYRGEDVGEPIVYGVIFAFLIGYRIVRKIKERVPKPASTQCS